MALQDPEVNSCEDIRTQVSKSPTDQKERDYLVKRAIDLGCIDAIPDEWEVEFNGGE